MPVCALRGIGYKTFAQLLGTGSTPTPGLYHCASPPHNCFPPLSRSRARRVKSRAESEFFCWPDCFPFRFTQCVVGSGDPSLTCKGCREVCAFMCSAFRPAGGACRSSGLRLPDRARCRRSPSDGRRLPEMSEIQPSLPAEGAPAAAGKKPAPAKPDPKKPAQQ